MSSTVGVIGLGAMGDVVTALLLKNSFDVSGYDILPDRGQHLVKHGLQIAFANLPIHRIDCC